MIHSDGRVSILLVDDRPEKLLALEAVLSDLDIHMVKANSGKEALRCLLNQEFAVILLDVNMPGMDGFETASLIRQRKATADVPIIFITAFSDELHVSRGYQLGAVDYILAPIMPDVLRTKISVFVDLYRKSEQVKRQSEWLRRRAAQLYKLTGASLRINSALSLDRTLEIVTDSAREVIGAHHCAAVLALEQNWGRARHVQSLSEKFEGLKDEFLATLSHELRTPLNAMLGWTRLLRMGKLDAADTAHGLEVIERNVSAQAKLIEDLLDVSRIMTGKMRLNIRPMSLNLVIESALDAVRPAADAKEIQLLTSFDAEADHMSGDSDRMQQVVWNLLTNAIKFTNRGGKVEVNLTRQSGYVQIGRASCRE